MDQQEKDQKAKQEAAARVFLIRILEASAEALRARLQQPQSNALETTDALFQILDRLIAPDQTEIDERLDKLEADVKEGFTKLWAALQAKKLTQR